MVKDKGLTLFTMAYFSVAPTEGVESTPLWKIHLLSSEPNSFLHSRLYINKELIYKREIRRFKTMHLVVGQSSAADFDLRVGI
jgi:hypothetical protein